MAYLYKAFISYRHFTPDQEIAKKLHTEIENYAIPSKWKKKLGIRRMGRVFRDQEELPLSANLGEDIHAALEQSEWLICVCSPRYLESRWCMEELRYFLSLGRREHVLALLAEGEPDTAFPEALRTMETDGKLVEVEPLAADVRAGSLRKMLKKLKEEKLRIIAPMLGVTFDDLKQRARQRRYRQIATAAAAAILLLSGFLGYALRKNVEITEERNRTMTAQSRFLANEADLLLEEGADRLLAMMLAREALPEDCDHPNRPVTDEALCALRSSLISGQDTVLYRTVTDVNLPIRSFGSDGTRLAVASDETEGYVACFRLDNGAEEEAPWKLKNRPTMMLFAPGLAKVLYADQNGVHRIHTDASGLHTVDYRGYGSGTSDDFALGEAWESFAFRSSGSTLGLLAPGAEQVTIVNTDSVSNLSPYYSGGQVSQGTSEGKYLTWFPGATGDESILCMLKASGNADSADDLILHRYYVSGDPAPEIKAQEKETVHAYTSSFDGKLVIGKADKVLYFWDTFTEEHVRTITADAFDGARLEKIIPSSVNSRIAVLTGSRQLFVCEYESGSITQMKAEGFRMDSAAFSSDGETLLCADLRNNAALIFRVRTGTLLQAIPVEFSLTGAAYPQQDLRGNSLDDRYILLTGENRSRLLQKDGEQTPELFRALPAESIAYAHESVLSPDGKEAWFLTQTASHSRLNVYNFERDELSVVREFRDDSELTYCRGLGRVGDRFVVLSGESGASKQAVLYVYDIRTHELIRTLHPDLYEAIGLRLACQNEEYAVFRNIAFNQGRFLVLDARTADVIYIDTDIPSGNHAFWLEGHFLFIASEKGDRLICSPVDLKSMPQEKNYTKELFFGFFENAGIPGFSDRVAVYRAGEQTCLMDLLTGKQTLLEVKAGGSAVLSADRKSLILDEGGNGEQYVRYDGNSLQACEPSWAELHPESRNPREYLFGDRWVFLRDGALYDSGTGVKQIDLYSSDVLVSDMASDGSGLLIRREGSDRLWLLRCPDENTLLEMADGILRNRELSPEERKQYFIE